MMVPVISIVGKSNSGKTTLIEKLIPVLKDKGYRVGAIKHDAHRFNIDYEGKDSWRMANSGAETVVIASENKVAMIKQQEGEKNLSEIIKWLFKDVDIVIAEGYKSEYFPKIEVIRNIDYKLQGLNNLVAIIDNSEGALQWASWAEPAVKFDFNEIDNIINFIEDRFLKNSDKD